MEFRKKVGLCIYIFVYDLSYIGKNKYYVVYLHYVDLKSLHLVIKGVWRGGNDTVYPVMTGDCVVMTS